MLAATVGDCVRVSALRGDGLDGLTARVLAVVSRREARVTVRAHCTSGRLLALMHESANVLSTANDDESVVFEARIEPRHLPTLHAAMGPKDAIVVHQMPATSATEGAR